MKKTLPAMLFCLFAFAASAQEKAVTKPYLVHTIYANATIENRSVNVDSLLMIYKKDILDPNPYYKNNKIVMHWYGHDSREILIISELNNWADVALAEAKQDDIIKHLPKSMDKAGEQWFSVILPEHHSDEIYRVVAE